MKRVFFPVFQAVVDVRSRQVCWVEALARISGDDSGKGHVPFIRMAESYGFIHHLDNAIVDSVLDVQQAIGMPVAVNVSVITIERHPAAVLDLLQQRPVAARHVILEITETAQVQQLLQVKEFVKVAKEFGCKIAIDDFGTGFFTAQLVMALAPDIIKLSRALVARVFQTGNLALIAEITSVGREVGADLLAEGIDSWPKFQMLDRIGCRYAQGYIIGRPSPIASLAGTTCLPALSEVD